MKLSATVITSMSVKKKIEEKFQVEKVKNTETK